MDMSTTNMSLLEDDKNIEEMHYYTVQFLQRSKYLLN